VTLHRPVVVVFKKIHHYPPPFSGDVEIDESYFGERRMNLSVAIALSMALNHSGRMPNEGLQNSMLFHEKLFIHT